MDNDRIVEIGAQAVDPNAWVVTREDRVTWLSNIPDERILASKHSRRQKARWSTRRVLAAFEEAGLVVEQGWQPIETAPKDGTWVLLFLPDDDSGPEVVIEAQWSSTVSGHWVEAFSEAWVEPSAPTHWRPRFDPPAKADPQ